MKLRVALLQSALSWGDPAANRERFERLLTPLAGTVDLAVLPEMFTTGFQMEPERHAEHDPGATRAWMLAMAARIDAAVCGSVAVRDGGRYYNRLLWAAPGQVVAQYDKRHLFRMGGEHEHYQAGHAALVIEHRGFRVCPLVCYDLRFPVWSRRRPGLDYELLLYVANWPAARAYPWSQLLRARAIENQCYVVGVNRVGPDGKGVAHGGASAAIDFLGMPLAELGQEEAVRLVELDGAALAEFRERFPAQLDADRFTLDA